MQAIVRGHKANNSGVKNVTKYPQKKIIDKLISSDQCATLRA